MKIKLKFGLSVIEIEADSLKDLFKQSSFFSNISKCKMCDSEDLALNYRKVTAKQGDNIGKSFEYYSIKCKSCESEAKLGQNQDGEGLFIKEWIGPEKELPEISKSNNKSLKSPFPSDNQSVPF